MKLTVTRRIELEAKYLDLSVAVRYEDEDIPFDAPLRTGDMWHAVINLETHKIDNWPQGKTLNIKNMKVCDQGTYILLDADRNEVARIDEDYVPNRLLPGEYGDYLTLDIDETGTITNWLPRASLADFQKDED